ncbi:ATP-binding protein [Cohnella panacarvi]|uniref:ATP-binding protein n=1 Tax=Cohnella panacarvi TaxID=400776 RepID=UPI00047D3A34|nr:ATP-binding protein [Cohnella panacarvi]
MTIRKPFLIPFLIGLAMVAAYFLWPGVWRKEGFEGLMVNNVLQTAASLFSAVVIMYAYYSSDKEAKFLKFYGLGFVVNTLALAIWTCGTYSRNTEPNFMGIPEWIWVGQHFFYVAALYHQYLDPFRTKRSKLIFVLDMLLFSMVASTLYWEIQFIPDVLENELSDYFLWISKLNASFNAVIVLLLIYLSMNNGRRSPSMAASLTFIAGFILRQIGNTTILYFAPLSDNGEWSWISDMSWFMGSILIGITPLLVIGRNFNEIRVAPTSRASHLVRRYGTIVLASIALIAIVCTLGKFTPVSVGAILTIVLLAVRLSVGIWELETVDIALKQTGVNYRNFVENSLIGVFVEQKGELVYVNRHAVLIFGTDAGEMLGRPLADFIIPADRERLKREFPTLNERGYSARLRVTACKEDGTEIFLELQAYSAYYKGKSAISGTILDVTENKMSEQLLIRSEKLSVVGQLAAGVAHEIRNPLTALKGFTQLLYKDADRNRNYYEMMLVELERINYIVGEFVLLSKPNQWKAIVPSCMYRMLGDIIPIMESQAIITNVSIHVDRSENLPDVRCDINQIKQVLINLMKNGIEAMPDGGNLHIRAWHDRSGYVVIEVEDQGGGIPQEVIKRLGEPFYTTKQSGTGLGLTVCFKIIQAHGGALTFTSLPNQGTVASVRLPVEGPAEELRVG